MPGITLVLRVCLQPALEPAGHPEQRQPAGTTPVVYWIEAYADLRGIAVQY
jgi:hypothetical protein